MRDGEGYVLSGAGGEAPRVERGLVRALVLSGLLARREAEKFKASAAAVAWLKRRQDRSRFRSQHRISATQRLGDGSTVW